MKYSFVRFQLQDNVKVSKAPCFDRNYGGERVKGIALSPPHLLSTFFAVKFAFRLYTSGRNFKHYAVFVLLKFTS